MPKNRFYVTTPIFYPNARLHLGNAYVLTIADALARYHRPTDGDDNVYFLAGSDENTAKILKSSGVPNSPKGVSGVSDTSGVSKEAAMSKEDVAKFLASAAASAQNLHKELDISVNQFIRTTNKNVHWPGAIAIWKALEAAGDLYKGKYTGLYCVGCESFYTEKELVDGKCPIHLTIPEKIEEENYFFRLAKYTLPIKSKIESGELNIIPETRKNEILALLGRGLEDISFSRPIANVPHGIPVPGDPSQVIYVWCDALVNYISALGYGREDDKLFKKFWPADVHVIGKDILRFHAAIWPAMLLSAKLPLPKNIFVHGFITSGGHKMSKSIGNVIDPDELINEYGKDAVRYYLLRRISPFEDGDLTREGFRVAYNADLANGLGNLTARIMKMAESHLPKAVEPAKDDTLQDFKDSFKRFDIKSAADIVWKEVGDIDAEIQKTQPFKLVKSDKEKAIKIIESLVLRLYTVGCMLDPLLPSTSTKIKTAVKSNKMPEKPLFPRKD